METAKYFFEEQAEDIILEHLCLSTGAIPPKTLEQDILARQKLMAKGQVPDLKNWLIKEGHLTQRQFAQLIPGYRIVAKIGESNLGILYKAFHLQMKRWVVIKLLNPKFAKHESETMHFLREIYALGKFDHPYVLRGLDSGKLGNLYYVVTEYFDGASLEQYVKAHGCLSERAALHLGLQVLSALEHLWQHGFVHRDLRPANIMIRNRQIKLCDFGWIRAFSQDAQTTFHLAHAHCEFMSPEQLSGESVDFRSDVYSLGAILYFALCGNIMQRNITQDFALIQTHSARPLKIPRPNIHADTEDMVAKMLQLDPNARFSNAPELHNTFETLLQQYCPSRQRSVVWHHYVLAIVGLGILIFGLGHWQYLRTIWLKISSLSKHELPTLSHESTHEKPISVALGATQIYEKCAPSVVLIKSDEKIGSGVIVQYQNFLFVLTNAHVVEDSIGVLIMLKDGQTAQGEIVKMDRSKDLAIVQFSQEIEPLPHPLEMAPLLPMVGEDVFVIGHPRGYRWSLTRGTVSGVRGDIIQSDANIAPGNSGGPMLNANGKMIGLTAFVVGTDQAIGFGIAVSKIQEFFCEVFCLENPK